MKDRDDFEKWYILNAFDYKSNPIGSRDFTLQWKAWKAARDSLVKNNENNSLLKKAVIINSDDCSQEQLNRGAIKSLKLKGLL